MPDNGQGKRSVYLEEIAFNHDKRIHALPRQIPTSGKPRRHPEKGWRALERGILSSAPHPAAPLTTQPVESARSASKRRKISTARGGSQPKLAAFGFFGDRPRKTRPMEFERDWEAEEDLEFGLDEDVESSHGADRSSDPRADQSKSLMRPLRPVPDAPYHPSLRPAGVRELARREAALAAENSVHPGAEDQDEEELFPRTMPRSSSTDPSSLTTDEGGGGDDHKGDEGARAWWDRIAQRRSSEFGSASDFSGDEGR